MDPFGLAAQGNPFLYNFFSAIVDPETYRDYGLFAYREAAFGVGDWAVDAAELAIHGARKVSDPLYALKTTKQEFEALAAVARDPVAAFDALGEELHAYISDFDARDAGKLFPDLVAAFLGAGSARAGKTAADAMETAGRNLRHADNVVPGGLCFAAGTLVLVDGGFTPIEQLDVGDRVITTNNTPDLSETEVDPATWRALDLLMEDPRAPGYPIELTVLRSGSWMEAAGAEPGGVIYFTLSEMGVAGSALVRGIRPCPPIQDGPGRVVLSTIRSTSATVQELHLDGLAEPLRPTAAHPFYSEDRGAWVPAGQLKAGELIRTFSGPIAVTALVPKPRLHSVFNLEVESDHCYVVSDGLVLSHNANPSAADLPGALKRADDLSPKGGTYKLRDPDTGQVARTGRTNDLNRRRGEHARGEGTKDLRFEIDRRSDNPAARRGREQRIFDEHPEAYLNKNRPIDPRNKKRDFYLESGDKL